MQIVQKANFQFQNVTRKKSLLDTVAPSFGSTLIFPISHSSSGEVSSKQQVIFCLKKKKKGSNLRK